jgi:hypothetical protein
MLQTDPSQKANKCDHLPKFKCSAKNQIVSNLLAPLFRQFQVFLDLAEMWISNLDTDLFDAKTIEKISGSI